MCNCHRSRDEECQEECLGEPGQEVRPRRHDVPLLSQSQRARAQTLDLVTFRDAKSNKNSRVTFLAKKN